MFVCALSRFRLCDPMDYSPPDCCLHGIFQVRILEGVTISYSRGSSPPRYQTCISCASCLTGGFFTTRPPEPPKNALHSAYSSLLPPNCWQLLFLLFPQVCLSRMSYSWNHIVSSLFKIGFFHLLIRI